jgi:hypothetical protein
MVPSWIHKVSANRFIGGAIHSLSSAFAFGR